LAPLLLIVSLCIVAVAAHAFTARPTIARAAALTMNVRTNNTKPAAI
jgi:hypothetical protein